MNSQSATLQQMLHRTIGDAETVMPLSPSEIAGALEVLLAGTAARMINAMAAWERVERSCRLLPILMEEQRRQLLANNELFRASVEAYRPISTAVKVLELIESPLSTAVTSTIVDRGLGSQVVINFRYTIDYVRTDMQTVMDAARGNDVVLGPWSQHWMARQLIHLMALHSGCHAVLYGAPDETHDRRLHCLPDLHRAMDFVTARGYLTPPPAATASSAATGFTFF